MQPENQPAEQPASVPRWQQLLTESGLEIDGILRDMPNSTRDDKRQKVDVIEQGLIFLTEPGQVVELRILGIGGKKRTASGYFDHPSRLAKAAVAYDAKAEGLYFTLNPINAALLARAHNRVKEYAEHTTSDNDIVRRINLPIDLDPVRPAGISSSETEKQAALKRTWICRAWLATQGWPEPVYADSGNGAHLIYAVDLPHNADSTTLVKKCLLALSTLFSDDVVKVDPSTSNASRIFKLYGTLACKGDSTVERPHRRAAILAAPDARQVVAHEQLVALAAQAPRVEIQESNNGRAPGNADNKPHATAYARAAFESEIATLSATLDGNRNNQLFQSAAALFNLVAGGALDGSEVRQTLMNAARTIGLTESEARRTVESAEKHGLEQPRSIPKPHQEQASPRLSLVRENQPTHQAGPDLMSPPPSAKANKPTETTRQLLMHIDELDNLPPIRWLIKDLLPANSLIELHGAPSAGKTQVMFDMAQTLAATGQTVIYVAAEGLQGYRGRKLAWQKFRKQRGGSLYLWREPVHLFEPPAVRLFIETIKPKRPALIVFDTLSRCSLGADENNQKDMGFILEALDLVRRETGAAVVAVHHTNATGARERGSTVVRGGMDVMIEISRDDDLVVVSCAKMKDAGEFDSIFLKPILVDIGEERPVPVLVPADKRVQTQVDKLTSLQMEILRAVGMEMFAVSGIKSNQLDEILSPTTKRASKYHSLNTLIRLGYVEPHVKGDPYKITEAGRLKLSNAESSAVASKSNMSKANPSPFIWTLADPGLMSSPIPHTSKCGMDETLDQTNSPKQANAQSPETQAVSRVNKMKFNSQTEATGHEHPSAAAQDRLPAEGIKVQTPPSEVPPTTAVHPVSLEELTQTRQAEPSTPTESMSQAEIARYGDQVNVTYPTTSGSDLYRIAEIIPRWRRTAFEDGLDDKIEAYYSEIIRCAQEPDEKPIPDVLALYVLPGLVTAAELHAGYQWARAVGHGPAFLTALQERNAKAFDVLKAWMSSNPVRETMVIERLPRQRP